MEPQGVAPCKSAKDEALADIQMNISEKAPNFFIVGAPKCGTTAMFEYLRVHPDVFMPDFKEPHYFGRDLAFRRHPRVTRLEDYLALFSPAENESLRGEASVWYLYSETAAREIKEFCPSAKIIIMLRNPVEMMRSLHSHLLYYGAENITDFVAALDAEARRRFGLDMPDGADLDEQLLYRDLANYAPRVERYLKVFGRDRVHIVLYDDLRSEPIATYQKTLRFLDIDDQFLPRFETVNENKRSRIGFLSSPPYGLVRAAKKVLPQGVRRGLKRSVRRINTVRAPRRSLDPALKRQLQMEFAPAVEGLERLIDSDLQSWKGRDPSVRATQASVSRSARSVPHGLSKASASRM